MLSGTFLVRRQAIWWSLWYQMRSMEVLNGSKGGVDEVEDNAYNYIECSNAQKMGWIIPSRLLFKVNLLTYSFIARSFARKHVPESYTKV